MLLHVCPNPRNGPGVNPDVNHGLQEMTIYPIVTNVPSGGNADREGGCACVENSVMATGLENISFHFNPKEKECQRMLKLPHNCTHLTC